MTGHNIPVLPTATPIDKSAIKDLYHPAETVAIEPTYGDDTATPQRLCEYDEGAQSGCRRTGTILALEAEYDTFVSPEMVWGVWDLFCYHEGHIYYDKEHIENLIIRDEKEKAEVANNTTVQQKLKKIQTFLGYNIDQPNSMDNIKELFAANLGLPTLTSQTHQFFECEDVGFEKITADGMTRDLLNKIRVSFTNDKNPLLADLSESLYIKGGTVYCTDPLAYDYNPNNRLGVLMKDKFFPFAPLTPEQKDFVTTVGEVESGFTSSTTIIDL